MQNFVTALLVLGVHVLHFHYESLLHKVGSVLVGVLYGDVQTGKTTVMQAVLSLLGIQDFHYRKRCSDGHFIKITAQSTLGLVLDDPTNIDGILEKVMVLFEVEH